MPSEVLPFGLAQEHLARLPHRDVAATGGAVDWRKPEFDASGLLGLGGGRILRGSPWHLAHRLEPSAVLIWLWVKTNGIPFWDRCTTNVSLF